MQGELATSGGCGNTPYVVPEDQRFFLVYAQPSDGGGCGNSGPVTVGGVELFGASCAATAGTGFGVPIVYAPGTELRVACPSGLSRVTLVGYEF